MKINDQIKNYLLNAIDLEEISENRLLIVLENKQVILNDVTPELKKEYYHYFSFKFCKNSNKNSFNKIVWSSDEIKFLKENFNTNNFSELSKKLKKSEYQINSKLSQLNLLKKRKWTVEEIKFLKENICIPTITLANTLKRSVASIKSKKRSLKTA